jgi:protein disulfide-isomerase-like protein
MSLKTLVAATFVACASAAQTLTGDNFEASIAGKGSFIKFYAPWCGHCKKLAPAWDQLHAEFKDNSAVVIGDVDCTEEVSKALCSQMGVRGFPTLKYFTGGDPAGSSYEGGRDFDALLAFAKDNLGPTCSPANLDLCNDEQKAGIAAAQALSAEELDSKIAALEKQIADAEETFKVAVEGLQATYERLTEEKDAAAKAVAPELRTLRTVKASK